MQADTLKPESNSWLGFFLLREKLWINGWAGVINHGVFHTLSAYNYYASWFINNPNSCAFFPHAKQHLFNTHKARTLFYKSLKLKALGDKLMLYPQPGLHYTITTKFFNT